MRILGAFAEKRSTGQEEGGLLCVSLNVFAPGGRRKMVSSG